MAFKGAANIDPNQHKGLILSNSITNGTLVATGLSLTNAQPLHVAIVDSSGSQVVPAGSGSTGDVNIKQVNGATVNVGTGAASTGTQRVAVASDSTINAVQSGTWNVNNISGTISLPTGASTAANQTTGNTSLASIDSKIPSSLTVTSTRLLVDGSGVTQPISVASLPLPSGAATSTKQSDGSQKTQIVDGSGNVIGSTSNALNVSASLTTNPLVSGPLVGQSVIAVTGTAVRLNGGTSQVLTNGIIISAPAGNVAPIIIGGSGVANTADGTGNGYVLAAGASVSFAVNNTNVLYINGHSSDYVSWAGS